MTHNEYDEDRKKEEKAQCLKDLGYHEEDEGFLTRDDGEEAYWHNGEWHPIKW